MPKYTTLTADFADSAIDRGHSHRGRLSGQSPSLPRVQVRLNIVLRLFKISLLSILCMLIARMEMGTSRVSGDSDIIT